MIEQRGKFWINFLQILYVSLFCADPSPQMSPEAFTTYLACQTMCHLVYLNLKTEKKVDGIFVSSPEEEWGSKSRLFFIHLWNNDRPVVLFSSFLYFTCAAFTRKIKYQTPSRTILCHHTLPHIMGGWCARWWYTPEILYRCFRISLTLCLKRSTQELPVHDSISWEFDKQLLFLENGVLGCKVIVLPAMWYYFSQEKKTLFCPEIAPKSLTWGRAYCCIQVCQLHNSLYVSCYFTFFMEIL